MKGQCGNEFKPYTSGCECCNGYEYCMRMFKEDKSEDNTPGDNYPLRPFEEDIRKNKRQFKGYRPVTEAEVLMFRNDLEDMTIDRAIKTLELYKEEK
jgi:hypothetical protein